MLPSRVVALLGDRVQVELADGQRAIVDASLKPDLVPGEYVLVDRGMVIEAISADEAQAVLTIFREIGELLDAEDALT